MNICRLILSFRQFLCGEDLFSPSIEKKHQYFLIPVNRNCLHHLFCDDGPPTEGMIGAHRTYSVGTMSKLPLPFLFPYTVEAGRSDYDSKGRKERQDVGPLLGIYRSALLHGQGPRAHHSTPHCMDGNDLWRSQPATQRYLTQAISQRPNCCLQA